MSGITLKNIRKIQKRTHRVNLWITKCLITSGGNSETQQAFSLRLQRRNHTFIQYFRGEKLAWKITYKGRERNQHFHLKGTEISMLFPLLYSRLILNSFKMNEFVKQYYCVNILNHSQLKIPTSVHSQNNYKNY